MKYTVFSDIHSNLEALNTFLQLTDDQKDHSRICLGDVVGYGACPNECLDLIHERDIPVIMGNHEYALFETYYRNRLNSVAREALEWQLNRIRKDNLEKIKHYPFTIDGEDHYSFTHSSFDQPDRFDYLYEAEQAEESFLHLDEKNGCIGHTHLPMMFIIENSTSDHKQFKTKSINVNQQEIQLNPDCQYIFNPGSIGQPRDGNFRGSYITIDEEAKTCCFYRFSYDAQKEYSRILQEDLPKILAERILVGM